VHSVHCHSETHRAVPERRFSLGNCPE
jgi:hypothetical protein